MAAVAGITTAEDAEKALLARIVDRILARFRPLKIVLFGSRASGTPHEQSDVDLLVIMESDLRPAQRSAAVALACHPAGVPMDVIVRTPAEVRERLAMGDHFLARILQTGEVLYEHP